MKTNNESIIRRLRGQMIVMMAVSLVVLLGAAGLVIDLSRLYYGYQELLTAAQNAALAGGTVLSNDTAAQAIATATQYSAINGNLNAASNLTNVTMVAGYPKVKCLTSLGILCSASPANANAIAVAEHATVPTTFLKAVGIT
jgi:Flp pilus assembly protein TadG